MSDQVPTDKERIAELERRVALLEAIIRRLIPDRSDDV
jgi:uncharacterized coiled-coil protein SlyX